MERDLKYYITGGTPKKDIERIRLLLQQVKELHNIDFEEISLDEKQERELKSRALWSLSVLNRIKISQTRKTKSLYPQLVVSINGEPVTFYPQERAGKRISIEDFLNGLLNNEIKCLHDLSPDLVRITRI